MFVYKGDDLHYKEVRRVIDIVLDKDLDGQTLNDDKRAFV